MIRKLLTILIGGGILAIFNWVYSGSITSGVIPVRCDTCHVSGARTVSPGTTEEAGAVGNTRNPVPASRGMVEPSRAAKDTKAILLEVTAYSETGNPTASGKWPRRGLIAADTDYFPFGTKMYIPGYGMAEVADRGGAIEGNRPVKGDGKANLDVYFESENQARAWGRRVVKVYVYK